MTLEYNLALNFNNHIPVKTDMTFKQGDKGITLNLSTTGLTTTGTEAHIVFKRSNGTSVEAELTGQNGPNYTYTILGNEFEIPGVVVADLKLYDGDTQRVSTASFIFLVTGDTMDGIGGGTGGYSDQLEQLSQEFADTLEQYEEAFADVGAVHAAGNYDPTTEYSPLDLVYYATDNSTYLCVEQCTGETPSPSSSYWQLVVDGSSVATPNLDDLGDVDASSPSDGDVLKFDANSGDWIAAPESGGEGSNPNLLLNGWFTVNQRRQNSYTTSNAYTVDCWTIQGSNTTLAVSSNGISLSRSDSNAPKIQQILENNPFEGQTVTVSARFQNGTIISASGEAPSTTEEKTLVLSSSISVVLGLYQGTAYVQVIGAANNTLSLRAIKLEIGSTSTLHLDTAPDYSIELTKCRRFYKRITIPSNYTGLGLVEIESATDGRFFISLSVPMRTTPTVTYSGNWYITDAGNNRQVSAMTVKDMTDDDVQLQLTSSSMTAGDLGKLFGNPSGSYIELSAEL